MIQLQRSIGNASVSRLIVQRCPAGEVPEEGCAECGQKPVQRQAAAPPSAQRQSADRPTVRFGSSGPAVTELQSRLRDAGASIAVDGDFGRETAQAVKVAQGSAGLTADGIVGPRTWAALDAGINMPGGGTPPRGYPQLLEQVRTAIGALRGAGPAPAAQVAPAGSPAAPATAIATATRGRSVTTARTAPPVQRQDDEEESGWLDEATEAAGSAWDATTEAAGQAWDYAAEQATEAWDAGSEAAADAWEQASESAGAGWQQGGESEGDEGGGESEGDEGGGGAWDAAEELWQGASEVVSSFADDVAGIPDDLRERFGEEIALLEQVISDLGRGFRLSDEDVAALGEVVTGLMPALDAEISLDTGSTCTAATQDVAFTNSDFKVAFNGLTDLNAKVSGRLGGSAGHVKLAAMPTFKVTCWDGTGSSRTVGAAKVTAKGTATFPKPAEPDETKWKTSSNNRTREVQGIKDYFSIVQGHEGSHVKIYTDAFSGAASELVGLTESAAKTKFNSIVCEAFKSQDSLDNAEGCVVVAFEKDASKGTAKDCSLTPNAAASCP